MSGPIIRKYGFPNFDKIFGERPLEHGADEVEQSAPAPEPEAASSGKAKPKKAAAPKAAAPKSKKA